jgi:hypothetical protein
MMDPQLPLKTWEVYQGLVQGLGETCWKIRSIFYTASSGLIAYGFIHSVPMLYLVAAVLSVAFFILEAGYKQIQDQYIRKSIQIERTLNDLLVNEAEPYIHARGISTMVKTPTWSGYARQMHPRRVLFWGPYLCVFVCSLVLFWVQPTNKEEKHCDRHSRLAVWDSLPLGQTGPTIDELYQMLIAAGGGKTRR